MSGVTARGYYAFAAAAFATKSQILARWDEFPSVAFPHATSEGLSRPLLKFSGGPV
jgi:hypothetical protein